MDTLFTAMENERKQQVAPLAVRMRPRTLEDVVGQQDAVGPGSWLRAAIEQDNVSSVILYGPAGTGKTSIAHVIAESTKATFVEVSAIGGTVSDLRREIAMDQNVPPFIIFTNATLKDMAAKAPRTRAQMLRVAGVGEGKMQRYGDAFLREIAAYEEEEA